MIIGDQMIVFSLQIDKVVEQFASFQQVESSASLELKGENRKKFRCCESERKSTCNDIYKNMIAEVATSSAKKQN